MYLVTKKPLHQEEATMYASELTAQHIGHDLSLTFSGVTTGGNIDSVRRFGDMVIVTLDGQTFNISEDMPVALTLIAPGRRMLTEPDSAMRHQYYAQMDARGVRV